MDNPENLGEESSRELTDSLFATSSGLIITAPYLAVLFKKCDLLITEAFKNKKSQCKAVLLCNYLATGSTNPEEHKLPVHKLLCGLKITDPIADFSTITAEEKNICDSLLYTITQHWAPLNHTSIDGLRASFLQREGRLEEHQETYFLNIEKKSFDMLLDQIPWNISKIKLSWMPKLVQVQWR